MRPGEPARRATHRNLQPQPAARAGAVQHSDIHAGWRLAVDPSEGDRDLTQVRWRQFLERERLDVNLVAGALGAGVCRKAGSGCQPSRAVRRDMVRWGVGRS